MPNTTLLFDSVSAAQEVAYALRAVYDGCNAITAEEFDFNALVTAAGQVESKCCHVGACESFATSDLPDGLPDNIYDFLPTKDLDFPISRAEVYWAIADWKGAQSAEEISAGIGFSKSTVQGHLRELEKAGAICGEGRLKRYSLAKTCPKRYLEQLNACATVARYSRTAWSPVHESLG